MSYADQDEFFALAYRTGTDHWTNIPFTRHAHELMLYLPKGALVLDIGSGRGRLLFSLGDLGYRVIGLENNKELVERGNTEIKARAREHDLRFFYGDMLAMPLADHSFDAAVDIGLFQHLLPKDHAHYASEAARVIKQDGFLFLAALSRKTKNYFNWHPALSDSGDFQLEGVHYHFSSDEELRALFEKDFEVRSLDHDMPFGPDDTVYAVLLLKKK